MKIIELDKIGQQQQVKNPRTATWYRKLKEDPIKYRAYLDRVNDWKRAKKRQEKMQDVIIDGERVDAKKQVMIHKLMATVCEFNGWKYHELEDFLDMIKIADRLGRA